MSKERVPQNHELPGLPMEVPDSPHYPIGRARAERDRLAAQLAERRSEPAVQALIEQAKWEPDRRGSELLRRLYSLPGVNLARRFVLFARYVLVIEQRNSPPPQTLAA